MVIFRFQAASTAAISTITPGSERQALFVRVAVIVASGTSRGRTLALSNRPTYRRSDAMASHLEGKGTMCPIAISPQAILNWGTLRVEFSHTINLENC